MAVKQRFRLSICAEDLNKLLKEHPENSREYEGKNYILLTATIFDGEPLYGNVGAIEGYGKDADGKTQYYKVGKVKDTREQQPAKEQPKSIITF